MLSSGLQRFSHCCRGFLPAENTDSRVTSSRVGYAIVSRIPGNSLQNKAVGNYPSGGCQAPAPHRWQYGCNRRNHSRSVPQTAPWQTRACRRNNSGNPDRPDRPESQHGPQSTFFQNTPTASEAVRPLPCHSQTLPAPAAVQADCCSARSAPQQAAGKMTQTAQNAGNFFPLLSSLSRHRSGTRWSGTCKKIFRPEE